MTRLRRIKERAKDLQGFKVIADMKFNHLHIMLELIELIGLIAEELTSPEKEQEQLTENMTTVPEMEPCSEEAWLRGPTTASPDCPSLTGVKLQSVLEQLANGRRALFEGERFVAGMSIRSGDLLELDERGLVVPVLMNPGAGGGDRAED